MGSKVKQETLADKISSLINVAPTNFGSDDESDVTKAQVVDKYHESISDDDAEFSSSIRKQNISLLEDVDNRYKGKKVSRKDIYSDNDESDQHTDVDDSDMNNDDDDDDHGHDINDDEEHLDEHSEATDHDSEADDQSEDEEFDSNDENEEDNRDTNEREQCADINISEILPSNEGEIEKGSCVKNQLKIWENLLEMRIKLQKCLIVNNKMPQYDTYHQFSSDKEFAKCKNDTKNNLSKLLDNLLSIQNKFLRNYPETKNLLQKNNTGNTLNENNKNADDPMNEEICSDTEEEKSEEEVDENEADEPSTKKRKKNTIDEYEKILAENHKKYLPYRNSVIQKWNDKTRIASGKLNKDVSQPIIKQIEFILNDKSKLIQRTQLMRSEYEIIGKKSANETDEDGRRLQAYDSEIYDDDDFYHQLLRELIEQKSADITDPIQLSKQWIKLQSMKNKIKRKIDTRATKGRRIRYNVYPKLVNFMAPITIRDTWLDDAKNELFNSLFGKRKARNNN